MLFELLTTHINKPSLVLLNWDIFFKYLEQFLLAIYENLFFIFIMDLILKKSISVNQTYYSTRADSFKC